MFLTIGRETDICHVFMLIGIPAAVSWSHCAFRHIICHSIVLANKPYTKDLKLKTKKELDRFPMFLQAEQINMLMLSHDNQTSTEGTDLESETLITVMKDIRYHKIHPKAHRAFNLRGSQLKNFQAMAASGTLAAAEIIGNGAANQDGRFTLVIGDAEPDASGAIPFDEGETGFDLLLNRQHEALQFNTREYAFHHFDQRAGQSMGA